MARTTARKQISDALAVEIRGINSINHPNDVFTKMKFWDEIESRPAIVITPGTERREYQPSDFKWGFVDINIKVYTYGDDSEDDLELVFSEIEEVIDANNCIVYDTVSGHDKEVTDLQIVEITTDGGVMAPEGIGEIVVRGQYQVWNP